MSRSLSQEKLTNKKQKQRVNSKCQCVITVRYNQGKPNSPREPGKKIACDGNICKTSWEMYIGNRQLRLAG